MPVPTNTPSPDRLLLRDRVRDQIQAAIEDGTLEPGERLNDDELITWLGVSRTPIREALSDLARSGLVEMSPNRYTRVAIPDAASAIETLQTLGVFYGGAVRLAVGNLPAAAKKDVLAQIDASITAVRSGDGPALNTAARKTFNVFVTHCGNGHLTHVIKDVQDGLAYQLRVPNIVELIDADHSARYFQELRDAVVAGDAIAAELASEALHHLPLTSRA